MTMLSGFDTIPQHDRRTCGRTDGRTKFIYHYRASA